MAVQVLYDASRKEEEAKSSYWCNIGGIRDIVTVYVKHAITGMAKKPLASPRGFLGIGMRFF